jgi:hypothetical protein
VAIKSLFKTQDLDQYIDRKSVKLSKVALKIFNKAKSHEYSKMLS